MSLQVLKQVVLENSKSKRWQTAVTEWVLDYTDETEKFGDENCDCGHPIKYLYYITNMKNNKELLVGSCCINKFGKNINNERLLQKDFKLGKLTPRIIEFALEGKVISDEEPYDEYHFLLKVLKLKQITVKQQHWFDLLKKRIFNSIEYKRG